MRKSAQYESLQTSQVVLASLGSGFMGCAHELRRRDSSAITNDRSIWPFVCAGSEKKRYLKGMLPEKYLKLRLESGFDCLLCAEFARLRRFRLTIRTIPDFSIRFKCGQRVCPRARPYSQRVPAQPASRCRVRGSIQGSIPTRLLQIKINTVITHQNQYMMGRGGRCRADMARS